MIGVPTNEQITKDTLKETQIFELHEPQMNR